MLLLDDNDRLSEEASVGETELANSLGPTALQAVDNALTKVAREEWLKVAGVVAKALDLNDGAPEESHVQLYVRRIVGLVRSGALEAQGNVLRPRFSEVRLSRPAAMPTPDTMEFAHPVDSALQREQLGVVVARLVANGFQARPAAYFSDNGFLVCTAPAPVVDPRSFPPEINVVERPVFLYVEGGCFEARITFHGGEHWIRRTTAKDELFAIALVALQSADRVPHGWSRA